MNFDIVMIDSKSNYTFINTFLNNRENHEGRITKKSRDRFKTSIMEDKNTITLAALVDGHIVGISCALLTKKLVRNSFTIVKPTARNFGIGRQLLSAKRLAIAYIARDLPFVTYVGKENEGGIKICLLAGLNNSGEKTFTMNNGDQIVSKIFSDIPAFGV